MLGRLAVDKNHTGKGYGGGLLATAIEKAKLVPEAVAVRALIVHALNDESRKFYEHYTFFSSPTLPNLLMLDLADI